MRNLSDTIARLSNFRALGSIGAGESGGRLVEVNDFGSNPGALQAFAYIPADLPAGAPLVVVLHGCTQSGAGYDLGSGWSELADAEGFAVLFPQQQRSNNMNLCFNWFVPEDIRREGGEAQSIRQMVAATAAAHDIDPAQIFVTGLSAGGAMTAVMLATYPEVFAGGAVIAGTPYGAATTMPAAFDRMRGGSTPNAAELGALVRAASDHKGPWPTLSVWQGDADHTVDHSNAALLIDQWRDLHGLSLEPTATEMVDGHPRRTWANAEGRVVIEDFRIIGMGHGTPLDPVVAEGGGTSGPYMLDVGIASTRHIASFWGLATDVPKSRAKPAKVAEKKVAAPKVAVPKVATPKVAIPKVAAPKVVLPKSAPAPAMANSVSEVIDNALRSAGLLR